MTQAVGIVEEVVLGLGRVLENAEPGLLLIDMSTTRLHSSVKVAQEAAARNGDSEG